MTPETPLPSMSAVEQARVSARRQARSLSSGLLILLGMLGAVMIVVFYTLLDYRFDQDPHRLVKITLGAATLAGIVLRPRIGLFLFPILAPFILWLPKLPIPGLNTLNVLLGSVFFSFALVRILQHQPIFRGSSIGKQLLIMLVLCGLWIFRGSAFPSGYEYDAPAAGLALFRNAMTFFAFFIALSMTRGGSDRRWLTWGVVLGLLAEGVMTIKMGRDFRGRAAGSIGQPNDLGAFFAMFTPLCVALIFGVRAWWGRGLLALAAAAGCAGAVLSVSRGAILALGVAMGVVAVRSSRVLTILLLAALISSPAWAPDYLKARITGTEISEGNSDETELESSSADRVETWRTIGNLVMNHPLEGVGFAGLGTVLSSISTTLSTDIKDSAHNTYLRFLGEMGLIGLASFLILLWSCGQLGLQGMRTARSAFDRQTALGFVAATIAMAISCMFGDRFSQVTIGGSFWVLAAVVTDLVQEPAGGPA